VTLFGAVTGAALGLVALPPVYEAEANVIVRPTAGDPARPVEPLDPLAMGTARELVSADAVVELVEQRTGWRGPLDDIRAPLRTAILGGTQTMSIAYRAAEPERARLGAQSFAESYLAYRAGLEATTRDGTRRNLEAALRGVANHGAEMRRSLASTPVGSQAAAESLSREAAPYLAGLAELNVADTATAGSVVQPADRPSAPAGPGPATTAAVGGLLALAAGMTVSSVRGLAGRRLRGRADLEAQLKAPLLAAVPRTRREGHDEAALVTLALPDGPAAESYRRLRARILAMADGGGLKSVMVAGPTPDSGTAAIAANLAVAVAATGRRVALVGADLRSPDLHRYFGLANDRGLSNVLTGEMAPSEAASAPPGLATLQVLPAGPAVAEPSQLLESGPMRVVLGERGEMSDLVVVEAPPALEAAEALTLAPMVDGIVVVADARHASRDDLAEVGRQLRLVGGKVIGAVLCNVNG
jgi:capsular exopolysaccharide synthesis family protein